MRILGTLFVVVGVLLLIYGGVTLFIPQDAAAVGPFHVTLTEDLVIPMPPILGLILLIVGLVMIMSAPAYPPPGPPHY